MCNMNLTVSIDDSVVEKARLVARNQGTSLQNLIRDYLASLTGVSGGAAAAGELLELMASQGGHSGGRKLTREDAYDEEQL